MQTHNRLVAGALAAFLALAGVACEMEGSEGEAMQDGAPDAPADNGSGGY